MTTGFKYQGVDLDDVIATDYWLIDRFVGSNLFSWGYNSNGQLANGNTLHYSSPIQVGSLNNWKKVSSGSSSYHVMAIKNDNSLWAWGGNSFGALGVSGSSYSSPVQVGSDTDWKEVATGLYFTVAIKTDGTLWAWGRGINGELGNNSTSGSYSSPIQIGSLTNWKTIDCSDNHVVAVKTDGTIWAWGANNWGQLGTSDRVYVSSPVQISSLSNWKTIACGGNHTHAIKTDGTLWAWGYNSQYALGDGSSSNYSSPIQIGSLTDWKTISSGAGYHTLAIKQDNSLWGWGYNIHGQLGLGNIINYSSPTQIGTLKEWKYAVAGGGGFSAAIKLDGTLWMWGNGATYGQLGNSSLSSYSSPIQVGALTNWKHVGVGIFNVFGLTYTEF